MPNASDPVPTLDDFLHRFTKLGKIVFVSGLVDQQTLILKRAAIAFVDQVASVMGGTEDDAEEFDVNDQVVTPFSSATKAACDALGVLQVKAKTAADTYLRQFMTIDVGLPAGSAYSRLGPALSTAMTNAGASILAGGQFDQYFSANFALTLPSAASPTVPDSLVTGEVL